MQVSSPSLSSSAIDAAFEPWISAARDVGLYEGARVLLTFRERAGVREFPATVGHVEQRDGFTYFGYKPDSYVHGLWGYARLAATPRPFGLQSVSALAPEECCGLDQRVTLRMKAYAAEQKAVR